MRQSRDVALGYGGDELREQGAEHPRFKVDSAMTLIVHQSAFLCGMQQIDDGMTIYSKGNCGVEIYKPDRCRARWHGFGRRR